MGKERFGWSTSGPMQHEIHLSLALSAGQCKRFYDGSARFVQARDARGRWVRFPARALQPFLTRDGVHGEFVLVHDARRRFVALRRKA